LPPAQNIYAFFTPSSLRLSRASRPGVTWPSCSSTSREIPQSPPRPTHPRPSARKKNIPLFVTTFPCLSRACLGKIIVLSITNGAKTREAFCRTWRIASSISFSLTSLSPAKNSTTSATWQRQQRQQRQRQQQQQQQQQRQQQRHQPPRTRRQAANRNQKR
jgi:hypothetical protein